MDAFRHEYDFVMLALMKQHILSATKKVIHLLEHTHSVLRSHSQPNKTDRKVKYRVSNYRIVTIDHRIAVGAGRTDGHKMDIFEIRTKTKTPNANHKRNLQILSIFCSDLYCNHIQLLVYSV